MSKHEMKKEDCTELPLHCSGCTDPDTENTHSDHTIEHGCIGREHESKAKTYTATWELTENPIYLMTCPHCKSIVLMSMPKTITMLKQWAKKLFSK